ncbi:hypothetical protein [Paraburkholderia sp. 2C]|jgi:hypothetical protein
MLPNHANPQAHSHTDPRASGLAASDPASDPPIPDQPAVPDAPSPGTPADVPDIGIPEPEPDRAPPDTGKRPGEHG